MQTMERKTPEAMGIAMKHLCFLYGSCVFPALLVAGCVQLQPQVLLTGDGDQRYTVKCSNSAYSVGSCYEQAGKICGSAGFDTVRKAALNDDILSMTFSCRS